MDLTSIQLLQGAAGAAGGSTYVDDVFSTDLYAGNSGTQSINNGINLASKGGLVWNKTRSAGYYHSLIDTVRGKTKVLYSNDTNANVDRANGITSFNANGYTLGSNANMNDGNTFVSWNFRKAEGFFDVVTYTGNGVAGRTIPHNLGCVPGCIMVKQTSAVSNWTIYHRDIGNTKALYFTSAGAYTDNAWWNSTDPTASVFTLGNSDGTNKNGETYVAYVFAGGASSAATARSVDFDGNDYFTLASSSDFTMGTGDFTIECWAKFTGVGTEGIFQLSDQSGGVTTTQTNLGIAMWNDRIEIYGTGGTAQYMMTRTRNQWYHFAYVRHSGFTKIYVDGIQVISRGDTGNYNGTYLAIGAIYNTSSFNLDGAISNFRVVKGTAVYTSSFKPPKEPLTNITNTKLLFCNNPSATGSTVTPGTITAHSNPTASIYSPFEDLENFKFGEEEDQNIIKTGSYIGSGNSDGPDINLGWEPQWVMVKNATANSEWVMFDSMRGITADGVDERLVANGAGAEANYGANFLDLTSTGFKVKIGGNSELNQNGQTHIYMTIRRPDGYVAKPVEAGTDVFAMSTVQSSDPRFVSNFPVDFATLKLVNGSGNWYTGARLIQGKDLFINLTNAESTGSTTNFDYSNGYYENLSGSYQSWMWKRGAGFDVLTYDGNGVAGHTIPHSLSKTPEMMWIRRRNSTEDWEVYHKGFNGGTNPQNYGIKLNNSNVQHSSGAARWDAPTATSFTVNTDNGTNNSSGTYLTMLFASVDGISKVGYYTGTGSSLTITTGFTPRFLLIKNRSSSDNWRVLDTLRGWGAGNDCQIRLSAASAQECNEDWGAPTSTGFTLTASTDTAYNKNGDGYIYYAHA